MIEDGQTVKAEQKASEAYVAPRFERFPLQLITLGGSPGGTDSGAPTTQNPLGNSVFDPEFDDSDFDRDEWGRGEF